MNLKRKENKMKKLPILYKRTELGQIQEWTIVVDGNSYYSQEGIQGGKITTNKPTITVGLNIGKKNQTSPEEQALKVAQAKWTKKCETGYTEDIKNVDIGTAYFKPMLCTKFEEYKEKVTKALSGGQVSVQPKLDGMRCIVREDGMWSRNGKKIISVPHIFEALKPLIDKDPDLIFDGELYCNKFAQDFNQIMHLVRQTKPTAQDLKDSADLIQYWIYDLPSCKDVFQIRNITLKGLIGNLKFPIVFVDTRTIDKQEEIDASYERWMEEGYEGQIIRLNEVYENKRSRNIFKRKEFITEEYPILSIEEGLGNKSNMAGNMTLQLKDKRTFRSNIKGSHILMEKIWKNKKNYIGKTATCKFFQLTPDGVPRFPYVIDVNREEFG